MIPTPFLFPGKPFKRSEKETGKTRYEWTSLSVPKRLEVIIDRLGERTGTLLAVGVFQRPSERLGGSCTGPFTNAFFPLDEPQT